MAATRAAAALASAAFFARRTQFRVAGRTATRELLDTHPGQQQEQDARHREQQVLHHRFTSFQ